MPEAGSTAPHLHQASTRQDLVDWGFQPDALEGRSHSSGRLVHKGPENRPESGIWVCTPGRWRLSIPRDELCHFVAGRATYRADGGDIIEIAPCTLVLFPAGWTGTCTVREVMRNVYVLTSREASAQGDSAMTSTAPAWKNPLEQTDLKDWGVIPTMIEGQSRTSGKLLHKGPDGESECGLWICTPGKWACHVTKDEFCHFLEGRATYVHDSGEVIEIVPDTAAFFPEGWKGVCTVHETVKKVYMIR